MEFDRDMKTKDKIILSSKALFYKKGYLKTTVADITSYANVNNGLFTYYFGTKAAVASSIYNDVTINMKKVAAKKIFDKYHHYDLQIGTATEMRLYMKLYMRDENFFRFVCEIFENGVTAADPAFVKKYYVLMNQKFQLGLSDLEIDLALYTMLPLYSYLVIVYQKNILKCSYEQLDDYRIGLLFRLLKTPENRIEEIKQVSRKMATEIDVSLSPLFGIE